jgi:hypothetical protein
MGGSLLSTSKAFHSHVANRRFVKTLPRATEFVFRTLGHDVFD